MKRHGIIVRATAIIILLATTIAARAQESATRPANRAERIEAAGIKNCFQVSTNLYRGAQPTAEGMARLKAMGI